MGAGLETCDVLARAAALPCWTAPEGARMLEGGKTNQNILITDAGKRYVVRFGQDIPEHGILRWHELMVNRAAVAAGLSPAIHHSAPGVLVSEFVEALPITAQDLARPGAIEALAALLRRVHVDTQRHLSGPVLSFWVFHILRDYARQLRERGSSHLPLIPGLLAEAEGLEAAIGPVTMVLGHNDLLPGNILKGVDRLWLIDWEYAGLGSPLFDLGGLASNNGFTEAQERLLLSAYHDAPADDALWHRYQAMKCASLLRETMWSMVSEIISDLDVDFATYTADNLSAYRAALAALNA